MFDIDIPTLIALIRSKNAIWNINHKSYKKQAEVVESWHEIAKTMTPNFVKMNYDKQKKIVDQIRKKWKRLRYSYYFLLRSNRGVLPNNSQFKYENEMLFIREVILTTLNLTNKSNNCNENDDNPKIEDLRGTAKKQPNRDTRFENEAPIKQRKKCVPSYRNSTSFSNSLISNYNSAGDKHMQKRSTKYLYKQKYSGLAEDKNDFTKIAGKRLLAVDENADSNRKYTQQMVNLSRMDNISCHKKTDDKDITVMSARMSEYFQRTPFSQDSPVMSEYYDEDIAFFLSLLTFTKNFTEKTKMEFRMEIMKLIQQFQNQERNNSFHMLPRVSVQEL